MCAKVRTSPTHWDQMLLADEAGRTAQLPKYVGEPA